MASRLRGDAASGAACATAGQVFVKKRCLPVRAAALADRDHLDHVAREVLPPAERVGKFLATRDVLVRLFDGVGQ